MRLLLRPLVLSVLAAATPSSTPEASEPRPPAPPTWTNGNKQGVGTALSLASKVWFTLGAGVLNEIYYPTLDRANTRLVELVVADGRGFVERETEDTVQRVEVPDPHALVFRQVNTSRSGRYHVTKTTFADPERPVVLVEGRVEWTGEPLRVFVYSDPSLANGGLGDSGRDVPDALLAEDSGTAMALASRAGFLRRVTGLAGEGDGLAELRAGGELPAPGRPARGNVAQLAELRPSADRRGLDFVLAIGFGASTQQALREAREALARPPERALQAYRDGWNAYLRSLRPARLHPELYAMSAMVLRALEDKTYRGAMIASPTIPWGDDVDAARSDIGGYHLVWSRDLYHVATALLAVGDKETAGRALDYLLSVQQRPDGSFPQNSWLDGRPFWPSVQMDEVAYPLLLAHALDRADERTYARHLRPAAEYLVARGPATPQERWEEESGYSPSTIAAEIAGLVAAAEIATRNGASADARRYRETAGAWAAQLDGWTVTRTGPLSGDPYFVRIAQDGRPDQGRPLELNNGAGSHDERAVVDAGFLELVRLGIRPADDPVVVSSLRVVDRVLRVETPRGPAFYRYNRDGYGEKADGRGWDGTGVGRLWAFLTGERGEYELAAGRDARPWLDALARFANEGRMLPEQLWDRTDSPRPHLRLGEGTGSATPLAWTCAQFIRLLVGIEDGRVVGVPESVRGYFAGRTARRK